MLVVFLTKVKNYFEELTLNPRKRKLERREIFQAVHRVISLKLKSSGKVLFHSHITGRARRRERRNAMLRIPSAATMAVDIFMVLIKDQF
jgi:hypothetical protein